MNPEKQLSKDILMLYTKGTPNRRKIRGKCWERKMIEICLSTLGASDFYKEKRCNCGGVFARFNDKAECILCGKMDLDFRLINLTCLSCGKTYNDVAWSDKEDREKRKSDWHYCEKC